MKTKLLVLVLGCAAICAEAEIAFTNNVPIDKYGIRFGVCDNFYAATNTENMLSGTQVTAEQPLYFVFSNTSSNDASILFPRDSRFAFELRTADGALISKTPKGETLSREPSSLTNPFSGIRSGPSSGNIQGQDFPTLTELFNFPSNGVYTFELKHWFWEQSDKKFILSDPVRLKVIKQGRSPGHDANNSKEGEKK